MTEIFNILGNVLHGNFALALLASLSWGVISILFSPCHLSSIPLIIGYITTQERSSEKVHTKRAFVLSLTFAFGILISIALIGFVTSSMGRLMGDLGAWGNYLVAVLFIIVALYLLDVVHFNWNSPIFSPKGGLIGALILGFVFGFGLGPCTFAYMAPVLGIVFQMSQSSLLKAMLLVIAFGAGQCSVIVAAGTATELVRKYLIWGSKTRTTDIIRKISGVLVLIGGFYFIYLTI